ncbi:penicillin acylase family protein [Sphingopyxis sp.]|uniref:penicillin acylase family protein n=1 Tax=Sphingopyxis sp. TaxID=1908224 RepID=UPI003D6C8BAB
MSKYLIPAALAGAMLVMPAAAKDRYDATIVRTSYGIPHIMAKDWRGAGYGVGYAYAQDNLCMIAEEFATVAGERSLHFGPEAKAVLGFAPVDNLSSDFFFRSVIDLPRLRAGAKAQGREVALTTDGYVAGYNRWLREIGPEGVPEACRGKAWVRPITTDDLLRLNEKNMILGTLALASGIANAAPPGGTLAMRPGDALPGRDDVVMGSNGWAFGGDVTAGGRGMVIGNPHFPWTGPNRFWQMHVTVPGKLDVMGVGIAGSPLPILGFNRDVAWTHTVTAARHSTLFQLKIDPSDPTAYLVDGKSEKMVARTISVPMGGGAAPATRTLYSTRYGPLVVLPASGLGWNATTAFAVREGNKGNQRALGTWVRIAQARNVGEVRAAVEETLGIPWVNTIAADRNGDALHADVTVVPNLSAEKMKACATPLSALAAERATLLDGARSSCDWDVASGTPVPGMMPAASQAVYARRDYVANSNDSYWMSNAGVPHAPLSPILGRAESVLSLRTRSNFIELDRMLNGEGGKPGVKVDHASAKELTFANKSLAAELAMDRLLDLCRGKPDVARGCKALEGWDRRFNVDSRGAYLFTIFWKAASRIPDLWGVKFDVADPVHTPRDMVTTGDTATKLLAALGAGAAELDKEGIALDARWGDVQFAPRGKERIAVHGGEGAAGVLNFQASNPVPGGITPYHGSSYIQIVGFDNAGPVADAVLSYSQSPDPASPHFADQTHLYSEKKWHRLPFGKAEIAADAAGKPVRIKE